MGSWATCARRVGALSGQETHLRHSVTTRMWTVDVPAKSVPAFARARGARRSFWARSLLRLPRARTLSGKAALPHVSALPRPASVQDLEDLKRFTHRTQLDNRAHPCPTPSYRNRYPLYSVHSVLLATAAHGQVGPGPWRPMNVSGRKSSLCHKQSADVSII